MANVICLWAVSCEYSALCLEYKTNESMHRKTKSNRNTSHLNKIQLKPGSYKIYPLRSKWKAHAFGIMCMDFLPSNHTSLNPQIMFTRLDWIAERVCMQIQSNWILDQWDFSEGGAIQHNTVKIVFEWLPVVLLLLDFKSYPLNKIRNANVKWFMSRHIFTCSVVRHISCHQNPSIIPV